MRFGGCGDLRSERTDSVDRTAITAFRGSMSTQPARQVILGVRGSASGEIMPHFDDKTWARILASENTELDVPAKPKAIAEFEAKCDFVLPDAHREFLLRGNGGVVGLARLFGVGRDDALDLRRQIADMRAD